MSKSDKTRLVDEVIGKLDHEDDSVWHSDGRPRVEAVRDLAGDKSITEDDYSEIALAYRRLREDEEAIVDEASAPDKAPDSTDDREDIVDQQKSPQEIERIIQTAEEEIAARSKRIEELQRKINALRAEETKLQKERDKFRVEAQRYNTGYRQTEAIQAFQRQSQENLRQQVESRRAIAEALGPKAPQPASPLDAVLSGRKTPDGARKQHPLLVEQGPKGKSDGKKQKA